MTEKNLIFTRESALSLILEAIKFKDNRELATLAETLVPGYHVEVITLVIPMKEESTSAPTA